MSITVAQRTRYGIVKGVFEGSAWKGEQAMCKYMLVNDRDTRLRPGELLLKGTEGVDWLLTWQLRPR